MDPSGSSATRRRKFVASTSMLQVVPPFRTRIPSFDSDPPCLQPALAVAVVPGGASTGAAHSTRTAVPLLLPFALLHPTAVL